MSRDLIATAGSALLPLLLLALTAAAAWGAKLIATNIADKRLGAAITLAAGGAAGIAADLAQHTVDALKDPTKPGTWNEVAAAAVKLRGIEQLRVLYPFAVDTITRALRDPSKVDVLLGTLLEKAVLDLKSKTPARAVAIAAESISLRGDEVDLSRPTVAPPAPIDPEAFDPTAHITRDELPPLGG